MESKKHKILCIVCPESCEIKVTEEKGNLTFSRNACRRGIEYAEQEFRDPSRVLTSTIPIVGGEISMLPVRTAGPVPKALLLDIMEVVRQINVTAPIQSGNVIIENLLGTEVALIAGRTISVLRET